MVTLRRSAPWLSVDGIAAGFALVAGVGGVLAIALMAGLSAILDLPPGHGGARKPTIPAAQHPGPPCDLTQFEGLTSAVLLRTILRSSVPSWDHL